MESGGALPCRRLGHLSPASVSLSPLFFFPLFPQVGGYPYFPRASFSHQSPELNEIGGFLGSVGSLSGSEVENWARDIERPDWRTGHEARWCRPLVARAQPIRVQAGLGSPGGWVGAWAGVCGSGWGIGG